jgi:xanthine dehydrogenase large subunit
VGGQEHFYLEGQIAYVLPQEQNQWLVHSSTQHPGEVQHWVAHALGWTTMPCAGGMPAHGRRLWRQGNPGRPPGGVGRRGRHKLGCPVKLRLDRDDDFMVTGKRHPFAYDYTVGFDDTAACRACS